MSTGTACIKKSRSKKHQFTGGCASVRTRFVNRGANSLCEDELLQLLLELAAPDRDTSTLKDELLKRFGSFAATLNASPCLLREMPGVDDAIITALKLARATAVALQREEVMSKPVMNSWRAVIGYCRSAMAFESIEQLRVLFLDKKNVLIIDEIQQTGTVDHTPMYPRQVIKRALCLGATAIILVHNHPSGDPTPSHEDIQSTKELAAAAEKLGIVVHDHLVIGRHGHISFKSQSLL